MASRMKSSERRTKNRGLCRDSHEPKTLAVKTIWKRGDEAKTLALQSK